MECLRNTSFKITMDLGKRAAVHFRPIYTPLSELMSRVRNYFELSERQHRSDHEHSN
jgi:hypothetical protein